MIHPDDKRAIFVGVSIAGLGALAAGLVQWAIEEAKAALARRREPAVEATR